MAQTVVLLIMAILSFSILGVIVDRSSRWVSQLHDMETMQTHRFEVTNFLNELIIVLRTEGTNIVLEKSIERGTIKASIKEQTRLIDGKETTYFNVTVHSIDDENSVNTYQQETIQRKRKRLEVPINQSLLVWTPKELEEFSKQFFILNQNEFKQLARHSRKSIVDCADFNYKSTGFLWTDKACHLDAKNIGTLKRPVILVVENNNLSVNNSHFFGVIIHVCNESTTKDGKLSTTSSLTGAWVSFCGTPNIQGNITYSLSTIENLIYHNDNIEFTVVEGSWRSV